jgi:hypothetical protein
VGKERGVPEEGPEYSARKLAGWWTVLVVAVGREGTTAAVLALELAFALARVVEEGLDFEGSASAAVGH